MSSPAASDTVGDDSVSNELLVIPGEDEVEELRGKTCWHGEPWAMDENQWPHSLKGAHLSAGEGPDGYMLELHKREETHSITVRETTAAAQGTQGNIFPKFVEEKMIQTMQITKMASTTIGSKAMMRTWLRTMAN
jgi:hypothetical protein